MPFNTTFSDPVLKPGAFVRFRYNHANPVPKVTTGPNLHDPSKEVFVLHPNWQGTVHALDLKRVTPAERDVLRQILNPDVRSGKVPAKYPLVRDILSRMDPVELVGQPMAFYTQFVKPFMHGTDCYRRYFRARMSGLMLLEPSAASQTTTDYKPGEPVQQAPEPSSGFKGPTPRPVNPLFKKK